MTTTVPSSHETATPSSSTLASTSSDDLTLCTFYVGEQLFGVEVSSVQEVIKNLNITEVPLADESVRGLINLRGQIVTAIDLKQRIEGTPSQNPENLVNLIVRTTDGLASLLVDRIGDVRVFNQSDSESVPPNLSSNLKSIAIETFRSGDELLVNLNTKNAVSLNRDPS